MSRLCSRCRNRTARRSKQSRAIDELEHAISRSGLRAYIDEDEVQARETIVSGEFQVTYKIKKDRRGWKLNATLGNAYGNLALAEDHPFEEPLDAAEYLKDLLQNLGDIPREATQ